MASQVTLDQLKGYLEQFGWSRYQAVQEPFEKEGVLLTGWKSSPDAEGYKVSIDPMVEQGCLSFKAHGLLHAPPDETAPDILKELLVALGCLNFRMILGKFSYDPRDGEVRFSVDVAIDDNTITYEQFHHCLRVVVAMVEEHVPNLKAILEGRKKAKDVCEGPPDVARFVRELQELLEEIERRHRGESQPLTEV